MYVRLRSIAMNGLYNWYTLWYLWGTSWGSTNSSVSSSQRDRF